VPRWLPVGLSSGYTAAPLWLRLFSGVLDLILEGLVAFVVSAIMFRDTSLPPRYWNMADYLVDLVNLMPSFVLWVAAVFALVFIAFETLFGAILGATPVARIAGMRMVTLSGRKPGVTRVALRAALALLCAIAAGIGPLVALVSPRRRMLHDILTGCLMLRGPVPPGWGEAPLGGGHGLSPPPSTYLDGPRR